jgi:hypothetical protein
LKGDDKIFYKENAMTEEMLFSAGRSVTVDAKDFHKFAVEAPKKAEPNRPPKAIEEDLKVLRVRYNRLREEEDVAKNKLRTIRDQIEDITDRQVWRLADPTLFDKQEIDRAKQKIEDNIEEKKEKRRAREAEKNAR